MMLVLIDHDNNTNICFEMNSQLTEPVLQLYAVF